MQGRIVQKILCMNNKLMRHNNLAFWKFNQGHHTTVHSVGVMHIKCKNQAKVTEYEQFLK